MPPRQSNSTIFAVLLLLLGMALMTTGRLVMNWSRTLYVICMAGMAICAIAGGYNLFRSK